MIKITAEIRALIDKAAAGMELTGEEYLSAKVKVNFIYALWVPLRVS